MVNSSCGTERILHLFSPSFQPADRLRVRARSSDRSSRKPPVTTSFPKIPSRRVSNARSAVRRARFPRIVRCVLDCPLAELRARPDRSAHPHARVSGPSARPLDARADARGAVRVLALARRSRARPAPLAPGVAVDRVADRVDRIALLARSRFPFLPPPSPPRRGRPPRPAWARRPRARPRARRRPRTATRRRRAPPAARLDRRPRPRPRSRARTRRRTRSGCTKPRRSRSGSSAAPPRARRRGRSPARGARRRLPTGGAAPVPRARRRSRRSRCRPVRGTRWTRRPSGPAPPSRFAAPTSTRSRS